MDIVALMRTGVDLATALAAGRAVYGERFNQVITLRAPGSFDEGDLNRIDNGTRKELVCAAAVTELSTLPFLNGKAGLYDPAQE
jgi:hypothetical protein